MLSHTAQVLTARRALAFEQGNPLVLDNLASHFVTAEYMNIARRSDDAVHYVLMRHRVLEDYYVERAKTHRQAVILGSGFDTKFQRHAGLWQRHLEVDTHEMVAHKRDVLTRHHLSVPDFITPEGEAIEQFKQILLATDPSLPTLFLGEGYFMYFSLDHFKGFFDMAFNYYHTQPSFGFDMISDTYPQNPANRAVLERIRAAGEKVMTWCGPEVIKKYFLEKGIDVDVWFPSRLQGHYLKTKWNKEDDKYVVLAGR
ncbi:MAG: class I SAM-dependent methyltransferase [Deltaproteobacteria bacterium]|nr:class I SAM-dependent methyltransferase [Deltaproteobacteria bacterium]